MHLTLYVVQIHPRLDVFQFRGIFIRNYRYPIFARYYVFSYLKVCGLVPVESANDSMLTEVASRGKVWML